jgi:hypothetical protein
MRLESEGRLKKSVSCGVALCTNWQDEGSFNILTDFATDVAITVEAGNEEFVGIIVLLEEIFLSLVKLPIVTDVAIFNHGNSELISSCYFIVFPPLFINFPLINYLSKLIKYQSMTTWFNLFTII